MISKLRLQNFRAYNKAELDLDDKFNRIIGPNGVGKTSLLEAMLHLGLGGSPWSERSTDVISDGEVFAVVAGKGTSRRQDVSIKLKRGGRKEVYISGKRAPKMSELLGVFPMTTIGPQEIDLVKGSPSVRRRMIDSVLCQMSHEYTLNLGQYRRLVSERNAALKGERSGKIAGGQLLIETWDEALAPKAAFIMEGRARFLDVIRGLSGDIYNEILGGDGGDLSIEYKPTIRVGDMGVGEIEENYKEKLAARRRLDLDNGETAIGPHRDEFLFLRNGDRLSRFGSWGQARAASISVIFAASDILNKKTEDVVTLLLDDCFAELDPENTSRFTDVASRFGQVIMTSPREIDAPKGIDGALFVFDGVGLVRREH